MGLDGPSLNYADIPDGLSTVAITITNEATGVSEAAALVGGVAGARVTEAEGDSGHGYPRVQAVQGWGLLVDQHSALCKV